MTAPVLTDEQLAMLRIEAEWAGRPELDGAKDQAVRYELGLSATTYYQRLNVLIDTEAALAADPLTVNRLRRIRSSRVRSRSLR